MSLIRVRLLIDTMMSSEEIDELHPMIERQDTVTVSPESGVPIGGRLVGALAQDRELDT